MRLGWEMWSCSDATRRRWWPLRVHRLVLEESGSFIRDARLLAPVLIAKDRLGATWQARVV